MKLSLPWKTIFLAKDNSIVWGGFLLFALSAFIFIVVERSAISDRKLQVSKTSQEIEEVFKGRLSSNVHALYSAKAYISQLGVNKLPFREFVADLEIEKNYPGLLGLGYIAISQSENELTCQIELQEPRKSRFSKAPEENECADPVRREAIQRALTSGSFAMTRPLQLSLDKGARQAHGFFIYLPVVHAENRISGVVVAPFDVAELFESISGAPHLDSELYNFTISQIRNQSAQTVYSRFDGSPLSFFEPHHKYFVLFGQKFLLTVQPFNSYFYFKDLYLSYFVGLVLLFISILILWLIKGNTYQLSLERKTNDILTSLYRETHEKVESLRRINEISRVLNKDLLFDRIVETLVTEIKVLYPFDDVVIYLRDKREAKELTRSPHSKFHMSLYKDALSIEALEAEEFFKRRFAETPDSSCKDVDLSLFLQDPRIKKRISDYFCHTIAIGDDISIVMLLFKKSGYYAVKDNEMLANICSQLSLIVKNSFLLKRVEDSNEAKNAFLANMSHEIRTPLNAIIGFSEMIFQKDLLEDRKNELKYLISKNGEQLIRIIDDILDLSKVEAGKILVEKKPVGLVDLVHEVSSVMALRVQRKNLELVIKNDGPIPATITTDSIRVKQILLNLIGNSIKFTEIGRITLTIGHRLNHHGEDVIFFRTHDTGIGISEEQQVRLFEVFSQGDESKTRKYGGAGLGLALSKKLAQELGGDLRLIHSERGVGSEFELDIEAGTLAGEWITDIGEVAKETIPEDQPIERLDDVKILLVEDSLDNQDIFNFFLHKYGAKVTTVGDGLSAVDAALKGDYDMILMDIQLPEIDGKEATRRIRAAGFKSPIVAITAHAMADEIESCLNAGCVGQITKPVVESELIRQVGFYLKGSKNVAARNVRHISP